MYLSEYGKYIALCKMNTGRQHSLDIYPFRVPAENFNLNLVKEVVSKGNNYYYLAIWKHGQCKWVSQPFESSKHEFFVSQAKSILKSEVYDVI